MITKRSNGIWKYLVLTIAGVGISVGGGFAWMKWGSSLKSIVFKNETITDIESTASAVIKSPVISGAELIKQPSLLAAKDYVDTKERYRIWPPKDWTVDTSGKLGAPVFFFGPEAVIPGKFVYKANINVMSAPANNNLVEKFAEYYLDSLNSKLKDFKVYEQRVIIVSGRRMMIVRSNFYNEGVKFVATMLIAVENDRGFVVTGTALESGYQAVKQLLDASIYSFNFL